MGLSPELTLVLVGIAIYLVDSVRLLNPGDGILSASGARWRASLGFDQAQLSGRNLAILSPMAPWRAAFIATWYDEPAVDSAATAGLLRERAGKLRILALPVALQLVFTFVVVPLCLFRFPGVPVAIAFGLLYLNAIVMLCIVGLRRERLDLPRAKFAAIALECLVCIPLSINLLRKLSLRFEAAKDMISVAKTLLESEAYRDAAAAFEKRIATALEAEEQGTQGYLELVRLRDSLRMGAA